MPRPPAIMPVRHFHTMARQPFVGVELRGKVVGLTSLLVALTTGIACADDSTVSMTATTTVAPSCTISTATSFLFLGELSRPGSATLSFAFSCNSNFRFVFSSQKGGLAHLFFTPQVSAPFVSLVPYTLSYNVGTDTGPIVGTCLSSTMVGAKSTCLGASSSDTAATNQNVTLSFSWNLVNQYPIAGFYADTLTFNVNAGL